ncbi:3-phenylpropionate/trans-cinnamate dioxygenase ferredoxin reductase subunit [Thiothrix eikelboomii]|uniref:3-phenylpropionate/trans-cinnamate dioxygenase ferredoxin reductase subunit n=1 Tax=Thiothrix eikelboomii TaxID=92487 RepID=A0A1T4XMY5_9GAMM|nr:FAD-dependent oxidoreductase [Thiothrix eikelboomii]SKA90455.1 3-phenylpropionate/trans-cinnamate dioxygenase ferredoxin reductase subunit [Thiothrix eikelboomii]
MRSAEVLAAQEISLRLGTKVTGIDRASHTVLTDIESLHYDRLVFATGTRPRALVLPGADLTGLYTLRGIEDADALGTALQAAHNVVIIGGGFIGLEVAATARTKGLSATVIEAAPRVMARAVAPEVSRWFEAMHRSMGTQVLTGAGVSAIEGTVRVEAVILSDGSRLLADLVLVGIGAVPNAELALAAGLPCPNGIEVDAQGRTSDPDIFAVGDCALHPNPYAGGLFRLESVQNAIDQAKVVAAALLGETVAYNAVPWFWSDQGNVKLQTTGLPINPDSHVLRGNPTEGRFTVFHIRDGVIIAADSVNMPADHMYARRLVAARATVAPTTLADLGIPLKSLLEATP